MPLPPRREVVREVVRRPVVEERRLPPPPVRRYVEPPREVRRFPGPPPMGRREVNGDGREQWELDLLKHEPGIIIESVREVQPNDPKYEQYLYGQNYHRVEGDARFRRGSEFFDRPPIRTREPVYMDRPVDRMVRERRPAGEGWRDNFRGVDYYDEDY